jgi:malto-oligosyltrehalose trehalohydrolase
MSLRHVHDFPFGAQVLPDGVRFRLWAPAQRAVSVQVDGAAPLAMRAAGDGWHELTATCRSGARYAYVLDDGARVPDPASRFQPDDVHGDSLVVDPHAYRWRCGEWRGRPWHETVLYELHVGACGGYAGVRARLAELADIGVTALEIMPVGDFPGARNWGYDGVLPFAPDAAYGGVDDLKALIDAAHAAGLMIFLDVVYNHFGPDGNHLHRYAPQFFRSDRQTPWGAAIDFNAPPVQDFFVHNALYWLREYRFDGLRFDAVHAYGDDDFIDVLGARVRATMAALEPERTVHLVLENERNTASHLAPGRDDGAPFDAQWNDDWHNAVHVLLTGEHDGYYGSYAHDPAGLLARALAEGFAYQGERSPTHGAPRGTPSVHLPPSAFVNFLQNHDQVGNRAHGERLAVLADPAALAAARVLLLLGPGIPLLFMGEDWGSRQPWLFFTDFTGPLAAAVRDGRRREFARFPAFTDAGARAKIPDPNAPETFAASVPDFDAARAPAGAKVRDEYRTLLALRRAHVVPGLPGARGAGAAVLSPAAVRAAWRLGNGRQLTIVANLGADPVAVEPERIAPIHATVADLAARLAEGCLPGYGAAAWLDPMPPKP